jgi:SacI restriction endonuclease
VAVALRSEDLEQALEAAYLLAVSDETLPNVWITRVERLGHSPSVAFIAAVGAVLLAKATDSRIDALVIQKREGSTGAYSLRKPATVLAGKRRAYGYDIGSTSDRDPINHGTLVSSTRWDVALERITPPHKPFFQVILQWLANINGLDEANATRALAAFIRVRRTVAPGAAVDQVPAALTQPPALADLVDVVEGFAAADPEDGARGMALVAAAFRAAGFQADVPSRNDPRRIDIPIKRNGVLVIGCEVKQVPTSEVTADTLVRDALTHGTRRALLSVLRPGVLDSFDRPSVIRRAERDEGAVLRITDGARELVHEALVASEREIGEFCAALPRAYAEALRDIRVADESIETWAAIAQRWDASG